MSEPSDLELLRRFEPIVRFTRGESFFPMAVDPYLAACDLWTTDERGRRTRLAAVGELTAENLADWQLRVPGQPMSLRFVQEPLSGLGLARTPRPKRDPFSAPSRLARVGIVARLIDAGFDLSLLVRGTVPGGTVAAAEVKYTAIRESDPKFSYHGRVIRQAGWTVCHYLFFYAVNDWRSSFAGANDHEADWEQCFVFVDDHAGVLTPVWFARAAHDEVGADLRRRWDDPVLEREGDHPVIFAGAGSHAAYIEPGEYLQSVPIQPPRQVRGAIAAMRHFWYTTLRQGVATEGANSGAIASVPFVDYARGDGLAIGPDQPAGWTPILIDDETPWVRDYAGLFGLDTKDRFAGERAPAGPKFARDGRPRQSWIDPVGFAGLQAVAPPGSAGPMLRREIEALEQEQATVTKRIEVVERNAQALGARVSASRLAGRSDASVATAQGLLDATVTELTELRRESDDVAASIRAAGVALDRLAAGDLGDPGAHLHYVARPQDPAEIRRSRILEIWSAIGIAAAIVLLGAVLILDKAQWWLAVLVILAAVVAIEAIVRGRFLLLLLNVTVILAVIGAFIIVREYLAEVIALGLLAVGVLILRDNVREVRQSRG